MKRRLVRCKDIRLCALLIALMLRCPTPLPSSQTASASSVRPSINPILRLGIVFNWRKVLDAKHRNSIIVAGGNSVVSPSL
ncbi:uncharacterized protein CLUP02_03897 [Colletotrichum lupini]|uniref:Secreted protein n=1 Tax=Colletotrichum lupini TaxID=145971 RepID=A0A9Q8SJP5_9PEZI|nr:uncharacterized protein CLUP02_03897 [Colletotrichum lupini]UQC78420.1 hypothetical protein CLUP02_03897 [Colletotrichum lupini]